MTLTNGLLVTDNAIYNTSNAQQAITVCFQCDSDLTKNQLPLYALTNTNGLWIGRRPSELTLLTIPEQMLITLVYPHCFIFKMHPVTTHGQDPSTLQCGMVGNVTSYDMDTTEIIVMLEGCKMPRPTHILASVIAVTFIGRGCIPKQWLKSTFQVRHQKVLLALQWLITHNPLYLDFMIDEELMMSLPEDDIPLEIQAGMRQDPDEEILNHEHDGYTEPEGTNMGKFHFRNTIYLCI